MNWDAAAQIGSGLLDLGGAFGGSALQQAGAKELQEDAQDFIKWQMQNRFQLMRGDLEAAGLNPLLAFGKGVGGPNVTGAGIANRPENPMARASAKDVPGMVLALKKMRADTTASTENAWWLNAKAHESREAAVNQYQQGRLNRERMKFTELQRKLAEEALPGAKAIGDMFRRGGEAIPWTTLLLGGLGAVGGTLGRGLKSGARAAGRDVKRWWRDFEWNKAAKGSGRLRSK